MPPSRSALFTGEWTVHEAGAGSASVWSAAARWFGASVPNRATHRRLVGLAPRLRLDGSGLVLEASSRLQAQVKAARLEVGHLLRDLLAAGDVLNLTRTVAADLGLSVLRDAELLVAVGAVTTVPLGDGITLASGPPWSALREVGPALRNTWVDVTIDGQGDRLREGHRRTFGAYRVVVVRTCEYSIPGDAECVALWRDGVCDGDAAVSAARSLAKWSGGFRLEDWPW